MTLAAISFRWLLAWLTTVGVMFAALVLENTSGRWFVRGELNYTIRGFAVASIPSLVAVVGCFLCLRRSARTPRRWQRWLLNGSAGAYLFCVTRITVLMLYFGIRRHQPGVDRFFWLMLGQGAPVIGLVAAWAWLRQLPTCFISYANKDEEFVEWLYEKVRARGHLVWYAPVEMKAAWVISEQLVKAIRAHDKFIIVLSPHSLRSEWVALEVREAWRTGSDGRPTEIIPVRLCDLEVIETTLIAQDPIVTRAVLDMAVPDFSQWRDRRAVVRPLSQLYSALSRTVRKGEPEEAA